MKTVFIILKVVLLIASLLLAYVLCDAWYDFYVVKMFFVQTSKFVAILTGSIPAGIITSEFLLLRFLCKIKYSVFR